MNKKSNSNTVFAALIMVCIAMSLHIQVVHSQPSSLTDPGFDHEGNYIHISHKGYETYQFLENAKPYLRSEGSIIFFSNRHIPQQKDTHHCLAGQKMHISTSLAAINFRGGGRYFGLGYSCEKRTYTQYLFYKNDHRAETIDQIVMEKRTIKIIAAIQNIFDNRQITATEKHREIYELLYAYKSAVYQSILINYLVRNTITGSDIKVLSGPRKGLLPKAPLDVHNILVLFNRMLTQQTDASYNRFFTELKPMLRKLWQQHRKRFNAMLYLLFESGQDGPNKVIIVPKITRLSDAKRLIDTHRLQAYTTSLIDAQTAALTARPKYHIDLNLNKPYSKPLVISDKRFREKADAPEKIASFLKSWKFIFDPTKPSPASVCGNGGKMVLKTKQDTTQQRPSDADAQKAANYIQIIFASLLCILLFIYMIYDSYQKQWKEHLEKALIQKAAKEKEDEEKRKQEKEKEKEKSHLLQQIPIMYTKFYHIYDKNKHYRKVSDRVKGLIDELDSVTLNVLAELDTEKLHDLQNLLRSCIGAIEALQGYRQKYVEVTVTKPQSPRTTSNVHIKQRNTELLTEIKGLLKNAKNKARLAQELKKIEDQMKQKKPRHKKIEYALLHIKQEVKL